MVAKMAAENLNLMYFSSPFRYTPIHRQSVNSHEVKIVEYENVEINNNSDIFSKMAAKMAAENLNLMYLSSAFRYKDDFSVYSYKVKDGEFNYEEINNNNYIISKMVAKMAAENMILVYLSYDCRYKDN